jgi:uncharacterized protein with FMN-binding domain
MASMKKVLVTGIVLVFFVVYAVWHNKSSHAVPITTESTSSTNNSNNRSNASVTASSSLKDGTYIGSSADAFYGTIQVKAVIQNVKITDVQFVQYPNDQPESIQVNQAAMPALKQEAIQAQSANVDIVTGATQTSQAFQQSLASALAQAE